MTATEISRALIPRAAEVCAKLLPNGKKQRNQWVVGSIRGDAGSSLQIVIEGPKAGMWVDFAGDPTEKGDLIGLWRQARGIDLAAACAEALEFLGIAADAPRAQPAPKIIETHAPSEQWVKIQSVMRKGTTEDLDALAALRELPSIGGLELASAANQLWFAPIWDEGFEYPCWILTDDSRLNAQARKMDGTMWVKHDVKCKTIAGCKGSWPVGLHGINGKDIAFVEGSPDHLAAWHYIWAGKLQDRLAPVSMFGANMNLPEETVPLFAGKSVFAFPHNDPDGGGLKAMGRWEEQAKVPFHKFDFKAHQKKDLNELVAVMPDPPAGIFSITKDEFAARRITLSSRPTEPTTRLFLAGKPVATPGNLVTLISKAKTGKTATIGGVVAAIVAAHYDRPNLDTFGFTSPHTAEAVILIDTEQSPFDAYTCHQRAMSRAAQDSDPAWLHHYALVGSGPTQLRLALGKILARAKSLHGGIFTVILDGVADFVPSVNDEIGCNEFIAHIRALAVTYDTPIICVIHSNEGVKSGDDGRGWLGKELTRKAESNLLLKKTGDVTVITSEKQRKAPITEADGIAFQWSDEYGRHVTVQGFNQSTSKAGRPAKYDPQAILECFPAKGEPGKTVSQVHRIVAELPCSISPRGFKDVVAKLVETGELERMNGGILGFTFRQAF